MTWRSVAAFLAAPLGALLVMAPLLANEALAQRHDRDRGADRGRQDAGRNHNDDWELLGSTRIGGFRVDRDTIDVGRKEGRFEKVVLEAKEGELFVLELTVVYGNNETERINLRQHLREGERSPPIDLKGRDRAIKRIEVAARAERGRRHRHRAVLDVYGAKAVRENWELLGEQKVNRRGDRDTIRVGRKEGRFEKIRLEVKDNDVEIMDLKVFFNHGPPQDVQVRQRIREGERTRPIDLTGGDRIIDRIELVYRTRGRGERATVAVYGLQGGGGRGDHADGRGGGWDELGCGNVGIKADRDSIRVGRREGRFSAIQLRVRGNDVNILDLKVAYDRGPPDDIRVRSLIRDGGETRPLDLRGERRVIDRIELSYKIPLGVNLLKGPATVCVFGRP